MYALDSVSGAVLSAGAVYKEGNPAEKGDWISKRVAIPVIGDLLLHAMLRGPLERPWRSSP
ncbi:MAG: hypothetical protein CW342_12510 [Thermoactinomycetaceae bacterium]|nr:hypothetical protein [Bacillota bacterium]MBO2533673.1 hypothetical protein [Thermoactinomycetaceae bacterium]